MDKDIQLFFDMIEDDYIDQLNDEEFHRFENGLHKAKEIVYNYYINTIESRIGSTIKS